MVVLHWRKRCLLTARQTTQHAPSIAPSATRANTNPKSLFFGIHNELET
jgi:hypothetical protein